MKTKTLEFKVKDVTEEIGKKEAELNRLKNEIEYNNKQLASRDAEMESYTKVTEQKIFQLEAKVKELGVKAGELCSSL
jgi:predicted  nucleic acid-binding Zn-ribbon protein